MSGPNVPFRLLIEDYWRQIALSAIAENERLRQITFARYDSRPKVRSTRTTSEI